MKEKDHPLSLKGIKTTNDLNLISRKLVTVWLFPSFETFLVMRLTRPSLFTGIGITCDSQDLPGDALNGQIMKDAAIPKPDTGIGEVLLLPQSFG